MEKLENKKTLIGYYVKNEELYKIANIIMYKSLKVLETKGNTWATNIIERKRHRNKTRLNTRNNIKYN